MRPSPEFWSRARVLAGVSCLLGAGLSAVPWHALAREPRPAERTVRVVGHGALRTSEDATSIAAAWLDGTITLRADEHTLTATRRALGARVDEARLAHFIDEARRDGSPIFARRDALGLTGELALPVPSTLDVEALRTRLVALKSELDRAPRDARFDVERGAVLPEQHGRILDVVGTIAKIESELALGRTVITAVVLRDPARRTAADLEGASTAAVLGEFETRYNTAANAAERTLNLRVAASKIDGLVLLPGEVFDFNTVVGERNEANGFRPAPVIAAGEITDGVGGGTCQISGTLHAAAFFAGLPITERSPHSRPSSYIKLGLDAMVTWPRMGLKFQNDREFPVVLRMTVEGGFVRARVLGPARDRLVSFVRRIDAITPFTERVIEDPSLPRGVRVLEQRGVAGFRVTRFRVVRDPTRNVATRQRSRDVYPPTTQIVRVGTGGPVPAGYEPPPGDNHPEYRADAYLVLTQGPGVTGTQEYGTPGQSGIPGWTLAAGMPPAPDAPQSP